MSKVNLKEYIHPEMDILFVALNAPAQSNNNRHWFSRNLSFWNQLYASGLITRPINDPLKGDEIVFSSKSINYKNQVYGVTDLNNKLVQTDSNKVKTNSEQVKRILEILNNHKVRKVCLLHNKVAKQFEKNNLVKRKTGKINGYGIIGEYQGIPIYEVPFHSASISNKEEYYKLLRQ